VTARFRRNCQHLFQGLIRRTASGWVTWVFCLARVYPRSGERSLEESSGDRGGGFVVGKTPRGHDKDATRQAVWGGGRDGVDDGNGGDERAQAYCQAAVQSCFDTLRDGDGGGLGVSRGQVDDAGVYFSSVALLVLWSTTTRVNNKLHVTCPVFPRPSAESGCDWAV
jgi:hypothetical protein